MKRKLITYEEAPVHEGELKKPCSDCPWARDALRGWLGSLSADEWLQAAHGEGRADCHAYQGPQCAGFAIYRANICKLPRDRNAQKLPADRERVFSSPMEFKAHHEGRKP